MTDIQLAAAVSDIVDALIVPEPTLPTVSAPAFWRDATDRRFHPKRGFETVLAAVLADQILTADEIVAALLASGEYHRVAPAAANARAARPVAFLLKTWLAAGLIKSTT